MIERDAVMRLLLEACPSFRPVWKAYTKESSYRRHLLYIHLGEFAAQLLHLMKRGQVLELPEVFTAGERLHVEGDSYMSEAATIGLLEGIWNVCGDKVDPETFLPFLERDSRMYWDALN